MYINICRQDFFRYPIYLHGLGKAGNQGRLKIYFSLPYERKIRLHVKNISPSTLQATKSRGCSAFFDNFLSKQKRVPVLGLSKRVLSLY